MSRLRHFHLSTLLVAGMTSLSAQNYYRQEQVSLADSIDTSDRLGLQLRAEGFFRNDEYASDLTGDYTLPGYRLQTYFTFHPTSQRPVQLELGLTNLYFWGASRYPTAPAYQDLPYWSGEGDKYTRLRLRPYFRAALRPSKGLAILLGQIEDSNRHGLIEPIYSPELALTATDETGLQIKYHGQRTRLDVWVDWQSFIFGADHHPEAFVFGTILERKFPLGQRRHLRLQAQLLAHHRGGVLNERADTVHTWINPALGIGYQEERQLGAHPLQWGLSVYGVGYTQRGGHYATDRGGGLYSLLEGKWRNWQTSLGFWWGRNYIAPFGSPFVQSTGRAGRNQLYSHHPRFLSWRLSYQLLERRSYSFGASAGLWWHGHSTDAISSYLGIYLSVSPYFSLVKR